MRWRVFAGVILLAAVAPAPAAHAAVPVLVVDGKGWGHGVGMAQDGAYWMGKAGQSTNQILGHFYPGTSIGHASGTISVAVLDVANRDSVISFPSGGEVRDAESGSSAAGFPVRVGPGGSVHVWFDGAYHAQAVGGGQRAAGTSSPSPSQVRLTAYQVATTMPATTPTTETILTTTTTPTNPITTSNHTPTHTTSTPPTPQ